MATSLNLQQSIAQNLMEKPANHKLSGFGAHTNLDHTANHVGANRMQMIPSPAQAMTILRALNGVDLKNYPIDMLETLLPLLRELLRGEIRLYKSISDEKFIRLNNIVHDVLIASKLQTGHTQAQPEPQKAKAIDLTLDQSHVMQVLRAINKIPQKNLDASAIKLMQRVKHILVALYHGNVQPLEQLMQDTNSEESQYCTNLIQNALRMAYEENL